MLATIGDPVVASAGLCVSACNASVRGSVVRYASDCQRVCGGMCVCDASDCQRSCGNVGMTMFIIQAEFGNVIVLA